MKRIWIVATILILLNASLSIAQESKALPLWRATQISILTELIRNNYVQQLAELIEYPLERQNPIPDIQSKEEFILHYPVLFDSDFKLKLTTVKFNTNNTIDRSNGFGLLNGEIWLNSNGKIIAINQHSAAELELIKDLTYEISTLVHPSVHQWKKNILVCETDKFLIRIDMLEDDSLRYVSWSNNKGIKEKPDLVLLNGKREFHGTSGGETYSFTNSGWRYELDKDVLTEKGEEAGHFLKIFKGEDEIVCYRCEEVK